VILIIYTTFVHVAVISTAVDDVTY